MGEKEWIKKVKENLQNEELNCAHDPIAKYPGDLRLFLFFKQYKVILNKHTMKIFLHDKEL